MTRSRESGFTLIEVLVSALLVGAASVTVLGGISTIGNASARQRTGSQATAVIQQEVEKWRSTSPATLANLADGADETRDVTVGGRIYHLDTSIAWAQDDTGAAPTCTGSAPPSYLKVATSATWDDMGSTTPPTSSTIMAMPVGGIATLQAQVKDSSGNPLSGALVTITGPTPTFGTTNVNGCVLFTNLDPGTYTVKATKSGFTDPTGNPSPTVTQQVTNGGAAIAPPITLGQAAKVTFNFTTLVGGVTKPAQLDQITAVNGGTTLHFGTTRGSGPVNAKTSLSTTADGTAAATGMLTPSATAWTVRPGWCYGSGGESSGNNFQWSGVLAGGTTQTVTVGLPAVNENVTFNGSHVSGIRVRLRRQGTGGCTLYHLPIQTANLDGSLPTPGLAPGTYDMCAEYQYSWTTWYSKTATSAFTLNVPTALNSPPTAVNDSLDIPKKPTSDTPCPSTF